MFVYKSCVKIIKIGNTTKRCGNFLPSTDYQTTVNRKLFLLLLLLICLGPIFPICRYVPSVVVFVVMLVSPPNVHDENTSENVSVSFPSENKYLKKLQQNIPLVDMDGGIRRSWIGSKQPTPITRWPLVGHGNQVSDNDSDNIKMNQTSSRKDKRLGG